jgi:hypothetical protein
MERALLEDGKLVVVEQVFWRVLLSRSNRPVKECSPGMAVRFLGEQLWLKRKKLLCYNNIKGSAVPR